MTVRTPLTEAQVLRTLKRYGLAGSCVLMGIHYSDERVTITVGETAECQAGHAHLVAKGVYVVPHDVLAEPEAN